MSAPDANGWFDISTAPKDGTRILWAGNWKPFDILPGGEWTTEIFSWTSVMSDGTGYGWMSSEYRRPDGWYVVWTHWQPLPSPPITNSSELSPSQALTKPNADPLTALGTPSKGAA